ncbi:P-type ATPase [Streptoalloteichus hindustanus]|uniref:E1-E2 ATPase n=1 Tax=Streptoalloteichus hindustanus TaxID=2017 RepID=A0A1M5FF92_STRHI|nr:hypothetical protein [Streptoalloteichus hindustanus]SHF90109.1 E1-E2 ATPase [Streptoalloteichus hindustanus]
MNTTKQHPLMTRAGGREGRPGPAVGLPLGLAALVLALAAGAFSLVIAGAVVLVAGLALQTGAYRWARQDLRRTVAATPRWANQRLPHAVRTVPAACVEPGDLLVVRQGELVPVDGRLASASTFDEAALGAGPTPVRHAAGDTVRAGATNLGPRVEMWATSDASDSAHTALRHGIETLRVTENEAVRALRRLGYALGAVALAAAATVALLTGDLLRAAAVLLAATPVPLLAASTIALTAGASRAARRGVLTNTSSPLAAAIDRRARRCALTAASLTAVAGTAGVAAALGQVSAPAALITRAVVDVAALAVALWALLPPLRSPAPSAVADATVPQPRKPRSADQPEPAPAREPAIPRPRPWLGGGTPDGWGSLY